MPFLIAKFDVTSIQICIALDDGGILTDSLKKLMFDKSVSKTSILVQFTTIDYEDVMGDGNDEGEVINIRKFRSVTEFMERVRSLDNVLESIESFSSDFRLQQTQSRNEDANEPAGLIVEEVKQPEAVDSADERISEINTCCICMDRPIERVLTCFHAYCDSCIDEWKEKEDTCPLCRQKENGKGDFDLIRGPSNSQTEELKVGLMRELTTIISELLGYTVGLTD